jgi:hypothetical protein
MGSEISVQPHQSTKTWTLNHSTNPLTFPASAVEEAQDLLRRWQLVFPHEDTWVQNNHRVPSLLVRIDCALSPDGKLQVYEVEERPAGIGISRSINPEFTALFIHYTRWWPQITVIFSPRRLERYGSGDDHLWATCMTGVENVPESGYLLTRCEPNEKVFHTLASRSVATIAREGDKSYGVHLGLWTEVSDPAVLPWDQGFVLKPRQGSKCQAITVWHPGHKKTDGCSTRTKIHTTLVQHGTMYCQPFIEPQNIEGRYLIYRVYFAYCPETCTWRCLGGLWMSRPNLKVHGASDSQIGPTVLG